MNDRDVMKAMILEIREAQKRVTALYDEWQQLKQANDAADDSAGHSVSPADGTVTHPTGGTDDRGDGTTRERQPSGAGRGSDGARSVRSERTAGRSRDSTRSEGPYRGALPEVQGSSPQLTSQGCACGPNDSCSAPDHRPAAPTEGVAPQRVAVTNSCDSLKPHEAHDWERAYGWFYHCPGRVVDDKSTAPFSWHPEVGGNPRPADDASGDPRRDPSYMAHNSPPSDGPCTCIACEYTRESAREWEAQRATDDAGAAHKTSNDWCPHGIFFLDRCEKCEGCYLCGSKAHESAKHSERVAADDVSVDPEVRAALDLNAALHRLMGVSVCRRACTHVVFAEWTALGLANVASRALVESADGASTSPLQLTERDRWAYELGFKAGQTTDAAVLAVAQTADEYVAEFDKLDEGGQQRRWDKLIEALENWMPFLWGD